MLHVSYILRLSLNNELLIPFLIQPLFSSLKTPSAYYWLFPSTTLHEPKKPSDLLSGTHAHVGVQ